MNIVPSYKALLALKRAQEGDIVMTSDDRKTYQYKNKQWIPYEPEKPKLSLYELNSQIVAQMPTYTEKSIFLAKKDIEKWRKTLEDVQYMFLLCHDLRYYTVIKLNSNTTENFSDTIITCLQAIGDIKNIAVTEQKDAIEFWVLPKTENVAYVGYLFPYDEGVVECH